MAGKRIRSPHGRRQRLGTLRPWSHTLGPVRRGRAAGIPPGRGRQGACAAPAAGLVGAGRGGAGVRAAWLLSPPFALTWERLRAALVRPVLVVDAANVMGSRPDGWWRDRPGAAARLRDQLAPLVTAGVSGLPAGMFPYDRCFPEVTLVVEGAARDVGAADSGVRVVPAQGIGDDAIVGLLGEPGAAYLVVTADRELRARCADKGAVITGPRWLLDRLRPL